MKTYQIVALALLLPGVAIAEGGASHDAHEHGTSALDIAIEGAVVAMELRAPGADIVGFEYAPEGDNEKQALAEAAEKLGAPARLFVPNPEAGCDYVLSSVELEGSEGGVHFEFHASYEMACDRPELLKQLDLPYFEQFERAEEIDIRVISEKGSFGAEATRGAASLDLSGRI